MPRTLSLSVQAYMWAMFPGNPKERWRATGRRTPRSLARALSIVAVAAVVLLASPFARAAAAIQAPAGGHAIAIPGGEIACAPVAGEWTTDADPHLLHPPKEEAAIGHVASLKIALSAAACATSSTTVELVATGHLPVIDPASVTLSVDEGRLDLRGRGLRGAGVHWGTGDHAGEDRCLQPQASPAGATPGAEGCTFSVGRGLPADPAGVSLSVFPAGGRAASGDVATFDATGRQIAEAELAVRPARVLVSTLVPSNVSIDLAGEASRVPLAHPEAVTSADCGAAACEIDAGAVLVRAVRNVGQTLAIRVRLAPHVFFARGDTVEAAPSFQVAVLPCGMTIASGDALRGIDDSGVVVKLDSRCAAEASSLRFAVGNQPAPVRKIVTEGGAAFALVRVGRLEGDELAVTALRGDTEGSVVGVARARTRPAPQPRATLELENGGTIDFIPTNRKALVRFASAADHGRLVLLPLDGVYEVLAAPGATAIRGVKGAAGFVALRFAYRVDSLPGALSTADLGMISDPVELALKEANVPAAIGASAANDKEPLVELLCGDGRGGTVSVKPGATTHIPFAARDTCRLVFHKERLSPEDGAQRLNLVVDVTRVDGEARPDAHVSQPIVLRPGGEPRYSYIKGIKGSFDHVTVRLSQDNDESHYVGTGEIRVDAPAAQWSVIAGQGHARIYATTAIPTGLYRVSDRAHSGILTLNFGAIERLTWLDSEGHDGFLGVEAGVMAVGLANDTSATGQTLTQVATVWGVGLSVPIANRSLATETSINLHAWAEYEISRDIGQEPGNPFGFVFGPSISIGNIGTNL
jgi:hypothetical protein